MKAKKLAEILMKNPDKEVLVTTTIGENYTLFNEVENRKGVLLLGLDSYVDEDEGLFFGFDRGEALKELKEMLKDLSKRELKELLADFEVESKDEFMKKAKTDEKFLRSLAKDYFYME